MGKEEQLQEAHSRALHFLAARDRSQAEVSNRLLRLGFNTEVIEAAVARLQEQGYVDDERFAESFVHKGLHSGWAERRIKVEMLRRGLERELVERALAAVSENEELAKACDETLMNMVRRRFSKQFALDPVMAERRLAGFLARRGYNWDLIEQVSRRLHKEVKEEGFTP